MQFDSLIDAVQGALQQELDILDALSSEAYRAPAKGPYASSVGMHLRHNLDHCEAFFKGILDRKIDYEARGRNTMIEECLETATAALQKYLKQLNDLRAQQDFTLEVREESDVGAGERQWLPSSLGRELQFLLGHTVHHNALIAMIVHAHGIELPVSFGVAPSTQRYEQSAECASS